MRNLILIYILLFLLFAATACKQTVDESATKGEINTVLDQYHNCMKNKQASTMMQLLAEDGLYCGTDPNELWDKKTINAYISKAFENPMLTINNYPIEKREIKVSNVGNSATVLEQYKMDVISTEMYIRFISHLKKENNEWKFDFFSLSPVPSNNDMKKINHCLMDSSVIHP